MVKGGKDNRSFRNIRRSKKKITGNRHTVLDRVVKNVDEEVLEKVLASVLEQQQNLFLLSLCTFFACCKPFPDHFTQEVDNLDLLSESGNSGVKTKDGKCMKENESIGHKDYQIMDMDILSNAITSF